MNTTVEQEKVSVMVNAARLAAARRLAPEQDDESLIAEALRRYSAHLAGQGMMALRGKLDFFDDFTGRSSEITAPETTEP